MFQPYKGMTNILDEVTKHIYNSLVSCVYTCFSIICGVFLIIGWSVCFSTVAFFQVYVCQPWLLVLKVSTTLMLTPIRHFAKQCCQNPIEAPFFVCFFLIFLVCFGAIVFLIYYFYYYNYYGEYLF